MNDHGRAGENNNKENITVREQNKKNNKQKCDNSYGCELNKRKTKTKLKVNKKMMIKRTTEQD